MHLFHSFRHRIDWTTGRKCCPKMASKKFGIVHYMQNRERGINKRIIKKSEDTALSIGEEKATLPVKNQVKREGGRG